MKDPNSNVREGYHVRQDPVADQINANVYPKSNFFS